jgi:hypothetical protein
MVCSLPLRDLVAGVTGVIEAISGACSALVARGIGRGSLLGSIRKRRLSLRAPT